MWSRDLELVDEWTLLLLPESGSGAPTQMVDARFAVGRIRDGAYAAHT
ncbi:hypothetical protein JOE30_003807 [Rhodococcus sp. PvP016]|uniref:Uncharacterized protein n=1 Tax=Rhodococcoides corynebacterioides TaxID=53972 RepID=A0ABS2KUI7_9NOCA|nr:hypothetical protein [Rhodococcus corynebacterioides]MBP1118010.1 hypothetical protein [Rhodococcus sp. PvP016]